MHLFAGPYNSEFGHELFNFQGHIRNLSLEYDEVAVCTKKSMRFLYEDFTDRFVDLDHPIELGAYSSYTFVNEQSFKLTPGSGRNGRLKQKFIKYGEPIDEKYDVIIHARTKEVGMYTNLKSKIYDDLFNELKGEKRVAFIGVRGQAYCPKGAVDLRDRPLNELADVLHSCGLVVGGSSGPIHFASLCGAKHLTWGGYRLRTFFRYAWDWNPFNTKCYILEDLDGLGYLKRRARLFSAPMEIFESDHLSIIDAKDHMEPKLETILHNIIKILNE